MKLSELGGYSLEPPVMQFRHEAWMRLDAPYSPESVQFIAEQLSKPDRDRSGSFSASGLGSCARQQQFTFLGMPKLPESGQRMSVLANGTFVHLRLQASGLTEGWLAAAEVPVGENALGLKGTMDGVLHENSVAEIKSQNSYGFRQLLNEGKPKEEHVFQVGTYMLMSNREKAVLIYENKDKQEIKEFVVHRDEALEKKIINRAMDLQELTADEEFFPMLDGCVEKKGWRYDYCAYKDRCPLMKSFTQAKETA